MEKTVKAKKIHTCIICNGQIQKGEKHIHYTCRVPRYEGNDPESKQVGVEYISNRWHLRDCYPTLINAPNPKEALKRCWKGDHELEESYEFDHYAGCNRVYVPTGNSHCKNCGLQEAYTK